jgi:hypothetical protein
MLLFMDSFDHYDAAHVSLKYSFANTASSGTIGPVTGGRNGINALYMPDYSQCGLNFSGYHTTLTVGAAQKTGILGVNLFTIGNDTGWSLTLQINSMGGLQILTNWNGNYNPPSFPNGVILASTSNNLITTNSWHYFEMQASITNQLSGNIIVLLDGNQVLSLTGVNVLDSIGLNTSQNGGYYFNKFTFGPNGLNQGYQYWDDVYITNNIGSYNTSFLGDVNVVSVFPNGDGTHANFNQVGGSAAGFYTSVNEYPPGDDSSYLYSNTTGSAASFIVSPPAPSLINILGAQIVAEVRKETSGTRAFKLGFGNGSSINYNNSTSLGSSYTFQTRQMDVNPFTSVPFTQADFTSPNIPEISIQVQ